MTHCLLDTTIISNVIKPQPSESLLGWMAAQRDEDLFIASLTLAEIRRGILEKPKGKKRAALDAWFSGPPRSGLDMIIAAVAGANECIVVTDNGKDFVGIQIINPTRRSA